MGKETKVIKTLDDISVDYDADTGKSFIVGIDEKEIRKFDEDGRVTDGFLLLALQKANGNISKAATYANCSRRLYYKRASEVEGFQELINDIRETKLDTAEDGLWEHVEMGNPHAIMFYLKTIGKGRGYTVAADLNINKPIEVNINLGDSEDVSGYS